MAVARPVVTELDALGTFTAVTLAVLAVLAVFEVAVFAVFAVFEVAVFAVFAVLSVFAVFEVAVFGPESVDVFTRGFVSVTDGCTDVSFFGTPDFPFVTFSVRAELLESVRAIPSR